MNFDPNWAGAAQKMQETLISGLQQVTQAMASFSGPPGQAQAPPPLQFDKVALEKIQQAYLTDAAALWNQSVQAGNAISVASDKRFSNTAWNESPVAKFSAAAYLLNARTLMGLAEAVEGTPKTRARMRFAVEQWMTATAPSNFMTLNAETQKKAVETQGESIAKGLKNLLKDIQQGYVSMTDESVFEVGKNVATTEGAVVFENEFFQLLEYKPLTDKVFEKPFLLVPPCINKFYILDLQPDNSFVRYACEQGQTVFLVSWVNPGIELGETTWDDYVEQGVLNAVEVALAISGADKVNTVGWCVGGTILATALAVMRARGDESVSSVTLLTTLLDCSEPGDLGVFIDEQGVAKREQEIGQGGIYPGAELGFVFQMLRANDLIWPYVVSNYLEGKSPDAFDLLYWNGDSTNLPGPMYCWYLRNLYLENKLPTPGALTLCGTSVDLGKIDMPSYVLATQDDHIVPWRSAYRTTRLLGGKTQFVLGASGHIAGVINPPSKNKRSHWINAVAGDDTDAWLESAQALPGSWWPHWMKWLKASEGKQVPARTRLGGAGYKSIEPAPGRYVRVRGS